MNPARAAGCESARRNDAMDVRMKQQVLSPCMQHAEEADLGAKMLRIGGDFDEGLGHGAEQQVVQFDFVLQDESGQLMRQA